MEQDARLEDVLQFYDSHPINEGQILEKLILDGHDPAAITEEELLKYDQDHYGGVSATDALASLAHITASSHVLDIGSGMGGPARYLAHRYGCRVSGLDLTESRIVGARRLTDLAGLADRIEYHQGNATEMPFVDAAFDAVISQETFLHIPGKARLISECARVLKPAGHIAFTDVLATRETGDDIRLRLGKKMATRELCTAWDYRGLLTQSGFETVDATDLSEEWRDILVKRLAMYRSLKDQTIERFGEHGYDKWDDAYTFFVGLFQSGHLGGGRFSAVRSSA